MAAWGVNPLAAIAVFNAEQRTMNVGDRLFSQPMPIPPLDPTRLAGRDVIEQLLTKNQESTPTSDDLGLKRKTAFEPSAIDDAIASLSSVQSPAPVVWGGGGTNISPGPPLVQTNANQGVSTIPDPVVIVRTSAWPGGMGGHWGLQQKIGYLRAIMHPYLVFWQPTQRLAQAETLLYEQEAQGGPNRIL